MQRTIRSALEILLVLSSVPLACYGSTLADGAYIKFANLKNIYFLDSSWHLLPSPSQEIKHLIGITPGTIYVETQSGEILGCFQPSEVDAKCWFEVETIPPLPTLLTDPLLIDCPDVPYTAYPDTPDNLHEVESVQLRVCELVYRDWEVSKFRYILTDQGEIWQWGYDKLNIVGTPMYDKKAWNLSRLKIILFGFSSGALLPFLVLIPIWRKRRNQEV